MWHVLHLIVRPIELLLGLFCILTAIVLYPNEEGRIQSKFEDFWVQVDDYQKLALSRHAAFMTQVARLETAVLDRIFGDELFSLRTVSVSYCCSMLSCGIFMSVTLLNGVAGAHGNLFLEGSVPRNPMAFLSIAIGSVLVALPFIFSDKLANVGCIFFVVWWVAMTLLMIAATISFPSAYADVSADASTPPPGWLLGLIGGFLSDILFIAATRWLVRYAGEMKHSYRIFIIVVLNFLLASILCGFALVAAIPSVTIRTTPLSSAAFEVSITNFLDGFLASLFVFLAVILLIHRALWPLLSRTLFKMADIGTKGRRAILTTVGLALVAAGLTGKVPELVQKLIEKLGG